MKVSVVFVRVNTKPEYRHGEQRLLDSYMKYTSGVGHQVVIINRYTDKPDEMFDVVTKRSDIWSYENLRYDGGGWDCGTWQFVGKNVDTDLLVCFNSSCYITGHNWLSRFVEAVEEHGEGLYGPLTSNEIIPHVRTPCMIFQPKIINDYPMPVDTREETYQFESMGWPNGVPNFTQWTASKGYQTRLVTWYGTYDQAHWRDPANIFRKGNQQSLIVKDRHCLAYEASDEAGKRVLEQLAGLGDVARQEEIERQLPRWTK